MGCLLVAHSQMLECLSAQINRVAKCITTLVVVRQHQQIRLAYKISILLVCIGEQAGLSQSVGLATAAE